MGRPIPVDDAAEPVIPQAEEVEQEVAEVEAEGAEEASEEVGQEEAVAQDESNYSLADLEAALADDDRTGWVPESRVRELTAEKSRYRDDAERYSAELKRMREEQEERSKQQQTKPRDFDAELKELKDRYKNGEFENQEDYFEAREAIIEARADHRVMERIKPVAETLEQERARIKDEKIAAELDKAAKEAYVKYPFLDIESPDRNDEAISEVMAERNELIRTGVPAVKALRLAVAEHAPKYVTESEPVEQRNTDEVAARRQMAARKAAIEATNSQPPNAGRVGLGTKVAGKVTLTRSVEDFARWEKMSEAERSNVAWAG